MNVAPPDHQSVPLLKGSEEQVAKLRKRLEEVFRNVSLAHDVVVVCIELSQGTSADFNPELAHVLRRCAADRLYFQMGDDTRIETPPATDRITARLRPGDGRAISQRASLRGMRASTYLAALVRAHVAANPPLTVEEIATLKQGVVLLAKLGQSLSHISRTAAQVGALSPELQTRLKQTHAVVVALERRTRDVARSALITWESRFD
jgi:predicted DNA binding CopG/RHH family protein